MIISTHIEAILFFKGEPVEIKELSKLLNEPDSAIRSALTELEEKLEGRGLTLVHKNDAVLLTTNTASSDIIETLLKNDLEKSIGKAGLETLSIVLYRSPVSRTEIDYIRGVNSRYIVRILLIRGLIERYTNPKDRRIHLYRPTFDLLQHLGVSQLEELPEYTRVRDQIDTFAAGKEEVEHIELS